MNPQTEMLIQTEWGENINFFDFLDKENGMPIKKMSGAFKLKQFVIHDARNLSHFGFLIIDLKALKDDETEIIEAFGTMYSARIILLAEGIPASSSASHVTSSNSLC